MAPLLGSSWAGCRGRGRETAQRRARSKKQGPASQVAEGDTWDPEANVQRLQHFWKALHWEPLFIIGCTGQAEMWSLFLVYLVSQGTGCVSSLWVFSLLKCSTSYSDKTWTFRMNTSWPFVGSHSKDKVHLRLCLGQVGSSQTTDNSKCCGGTEEDFNVFLTLQSSQQPENLVLCSNPECPLFP